MKSATEVIGICQAECTGCGVCENVCPKSAITMIENSEGFLYPAVDTGACTACGLCSETCPIACQNYDIIPKSVLIARTSSEKLLRASSSGGIFGLLAQQIISEGGIVFGAVFQKHTKTVDHVSTDKSPLEEMFGSKYVQSLVGNVYKNIRYELSQHRKVLFSGTPCQTNGLINYLGDKRDNLLTIDFICHGVPSPGFFRDMLLFYEKKYGSKISKLTFREKDFGWRNQIIKMYFEDGKTKTLSSKYFYYYNFFVNDYSLRKSCYRCKFYKFHLSDFTLSDAWEVTNADDKGMSQISINTEVGEKHMKLLEDHGLLKIYSNNKCFQDFCFEKYKHDYPLAKRYLFFNLYEPGFFQIHKYHAMNAEIVIRRVFRHIPGKISGAIGATFLHQAGRQFEDL